MRKSICNSNKINTIIFFELYLLMIIMFLLSLFFKNNTFLYVLVLISLCLNCILTINKWKNYIVYLLFHFSMFIFLISKPIGAFLIGIDYITNINTNDFYFCYGCYEIIIIALGLAGLEYRTKIRAYYISITQNKMYLRKVSFIIFLIGFACVFYEIIYKIQFFLSHSYLDYYNGNYTTDSIPGLIKIGIHMFKPAMCVYLITFPEKRKILFVLFIYILSNIPEMIVGQRAPLILTFFFCIAYYGLRDTINIKNEKSNTQKVWIGRRHVIFGVLLIPIFMLFLTLYNELRNNIVNSDVISNKLSHPMGWFLYEQGGTMDLIIDYIRIKDIMPKLNYFFGYLYDTFMNNSIIASLTGNNVYGSHSIEYVKQSHALATHLGYNLLGDNFLLGMGTDSTFVLNIYTTFGYVGLFIINYCIGYYLCRFTKIISKSTFVSVIVLYTYINFFLIPRADIGISFSFLVAPYFWFSILIIYSFAKLLKEKMFKFNI